MLFEWFFMRSEHKGNVRDVHSYIFYLPRKYSSFCVISLKWDNKDIKTCTLKSQVLFR